MVFTHVKSKNLTGHTAIKKQVSDMLLSGRMPHAMLFHGTTGIGKATMAFHLAQIILYQGALNIKGFNLDDWVTAIPKGAQDKVYNCSHPDFFYLSAIENQPGKYTQIGVEEIRKLKSFLAMTAAESTCKVAIVDGIEKLSFSAANALLKSLEEPSKNTYLILVSNNLALVPATIRSRCCLFHFDSLTDQELLDLLVDKDIPEHDAEVIVKEAGGSVCQALNIIENGGAELISNLAKLISSPEEFSKQESYLRNLISSGAQSWEVLVYLLQKLIHDHCIAQAFRANATLVKKWQAMHIALIKYLGQADRLHLDRLQLLRLVLEQGHATK